MDRQELLNLLKENLKISVFHPERDASYWMEEDTENVTVKVYFGDELICQDSSQFHITEDISITELVK